MVAICPTQTNPAQCTSTWTLGNVVYRYDGEGKRVQVLARDGTSTARGTAAGGCCCATAEGGETARREIDGRRRACRSFRADEEVLGKPG